MKIVDLLESRPNKFVLMYHDTTDKLTFKEKTRIIRIFRPIYNNGEVESETYYVDPGYNSSLSLVERN